MRTLLCICSLSLIFVCGPAFAEPEEDPASPTPLAVVPEFEAEALARLQKMKRSRPPARAAAPKSIKSSTQAAAPKSIEPSTQAATRKSVEPSVRAATPKSTEAETTEQIRERGADWLKQCLKDWDAGTHMTKKDWQRVCRRVSVDRVNELIKQAKK